jgi:hypothetical protein
MRRDQSWRYKNSPRCRFLIHHSRARSQTNLYPCSKQATHSLV